MTLMGLSLQAVLMLSLSFMANLNYVITVTRSMQLAIQTNSALQSLLMNVDYRFSEFAGACNYSMYTTVVHLSLILKQEASQRIRR